MVDENNTPTLEELEAQFPYDPTTETGPAPAQSSPIDFSSVSVIELYDWNAFTMKLPHIPFKTLHFVGKFDIDGKTINYNTGPLQPYDQKNDWYMPGGSFEGSKPFRLTGTRDMYEEFAPNIINALQATEIMPIVRPQSYRYPHFTPGEQTA
jgi:hypothetical protein